MTKKEVDDRFKNFGIVSFTRTTKINDMINHLNEGTVMGSRCEDCNALFFPPRADCDRCRSNRFQWFPVKGEATLLTFTTLAFGPKGFEEEIPYTLGVLDYGDFKVFGRMAGEVDPTDLSIGMKMVTRVHKRYDQKLIYMFHLSTAKDH